MRQGHQSLKHDFIRLKQTKQVMGTNLENLEKRLEDMQMLKFGQVIDQDALDEAQANHSKSQISKTQSDKVHHSPHQNSRICNLGGGVDGRNCTD